MYKAMGSNQFVTLLVVVFGTFVLMSDARFGPTKHGPASTRYIEEGEAWLAEFAAQPEVHKLPFRMLFKVLRKGKGREGKSPRKSDKIRMHLESKMKDGEVIFTTEMVPYTTYPNDNGMRGLQEALLLMTEGDHWMVWLPYDLAYGSHGALPTIPPYAPIQMEIELLEVVSAGKPGSQAVEALEKKTGKKWEDL